MSGTTTDPSGSAAAESPALSVEEDPEDQRGVLASSAVMAAGTVVSRASGFVRSALLAAALGVSLHAELFTIANTIPNMLYILLAGGIFNAVLVPQLVRAMRHDDDRGEAYTNRVVTLAVLFLGAVTIALVAFAPQVMSLYLDDGFDAPDRAAQLDSVITFARYCLPQVFFYGMFVLVGQILNARGRFGPMMWAPIANNVISVAVLVAYLVAFGPARGDELVGGYSGAQELVLGVGSTLGILAQLVILVPYLRRAGFTFRPRFDFRGTGLGHTARLGVWTVLFVVVNQVAYTVVVRLASGGTVAGGDGTGYTIYSSAFLIVMVPHSIVTVSLATAILPRLSARAAESDLAGLGRTLGSTLRTSLAVVVPFAALLPLVAPDLASAVWGYGAASDSYERYVPSLSLFGPGLVFFTVHYLVLRGFYALEQTRTVFLVQCAVAATNIAAALLLVSLTDAAGTSAALVLAYAASYAVGALISYTALARRLRRPPSPPTGGAATGEPTAAGPTAAGPTGTATRLPVVTGGLDTATTLGFVGRLLPAVAGATLLAGGVGWLLHLPVERPGFAVAAILGLMVGVVFAGGYLALARLLGLREVTAVVATVTGRFGRFGRFGRLGGLGARKSRRARHRAPTMSVPAPPAPAPSDEPGRPEQIDQPEQPEQPEQTAWSAETGRREPEEDEGTVPHATRAGDLLAGRYRLVDLLTESGAGRFWRAHDRVLERQVAVHVFACDDPRADGLMAAARKAATVADPRLLRVLDADATDEVCYVVNEWGWGNSLDHVVTGQGVLGPRRAAWIVSEVATAVASAHARGVVHGRLAPENVLVDRSGSVRVVGLCVDAALRGLPSDEVDTDLVDLAGLLYCALTGRWAGASPSEVPSAPSEHGEVLRPRRVRAGVPRALDLLCDEVLHPGPAPRHRGGTGVTTARELADYLADFVGDPAGISEALRASLPPIHTDDELVVLPSVPEMTPREAAAAAAFTLEDTVTGGGEQTRTFESMTRVAQNATEEVPTEAGIPIFGTDDDVSWLERRTTPVPPPPPFEEPPARPLFAPTPPEGAPVRTPRPGTAAAEEAATVREGSYWPFGSDDPDEPGGSGGSGGSGRSAPPQSRRQARTAGPPGQRRAAGARRATRSAPAPRALQTLEEPVPGRRTLRLGLALGLVVLLLLAGALVYSILRGAGVVGEESGADPAPSASPSPTSRASEGPVARIGGIEVSDFDPQAEPAEENPDDVGLAVDGQPDTAWITSNYDQQLGPGGLKDGVGLLLDLRSVQEVDTVDLQLDGSPSDVSLYLTGDAPTSIDGLTAVATADGAGSSGERLTPTADGTPDGEPARGRYLVVWFTALPPDDGGFRGRVAEVVVRGR